jgi:hypothetical protein
MDAKLVERLYNRRFWGLMVMSLFMVGYIGGEIAEPFFADTPAGKVINSAKFFCLSLMLASVMIYDRGMREIKKRPELAEVLNDELMRHNRGKAFGWGWGAAILATFLLGTLPPLIGWSLPTKSACYIVAMAAWLGFIIPMFIYMKR